MREWRCVVDFYKAGELVDYDQLKQVPDWLSRGLARPAAQYIWPNYTNEASKDFSP